MSRVFDAAMKIVQAEIIAERAEEAAKEEPTPQSTVATDIVNLVNIPVSDKQTFLDVQGAGYIEKFLVRSPSSNFGIVLKTEKTDLEGSYSDFTDVCAFEESGTYVFELTNIRFQKKCLLILRVGEPINFSKIFLRYAVA